MSYQNAKQHLATLGFADKVMVFSTSATVAEAAAAVGCAESHIAKSLAFTVLGEPLLIFTAGDAKIDNAKFKAFFGVKAAMIPPAELPKQIGHAVGGFCPFGIPDFFTTL